MLSPTLKIVFTLLFIAINALNTGAMAQNTYKCGSTYSQTPCPDGKPVNAADTRTAEQQRQANQATQQTQKAANAMEKDRVAQEPKAGASPAASPADTNPTKAGAEPKTTSAKKKKKKEPEFFTAQVAGESKADKKAKKDAAKAKAKADAKTKAKAKADKPA
jgi:hypothetical protein